MVTQKRYLTPFNLPLYSIFTSHIVSTINPFKFHSMSVLIRDIGRSQSQVDFFKRLLYCVLFILKQYFSWQIQQHTTIVLLFLLFYFYYNKFYDRFSIPPARYKKVSKYLQTPPIWIPSLLILITLEHRKQDYIF